MRTTLPVVLVLTALGAPGAQIPEQDARNLDVHNSSRHYSMSKFTSSEAWQVRAAFLRKQILGSAGLLPMPEKRPIHAEVLGKIERNGYTIKKVLLETWPGFDLGGDLYRPSSKRGPFPAVVSPHGHWHYGRLENQQLVSVPGRCINLALQGFVVFTYDMCDMCGYNDTGQLPHHWCSRQQDLWNINPLGVQPWDSIHDASPDFPSDLVKQSAQAGGSRSDETHNARASEADLLAWSAQLH